MVLPVTLLLILCAIPIMEEHCKKIARLIVKKIFSGLSPREKNELALWLDQNESNRKLFDKIINSNNYRVWLRYRDKEKEAAWKDVYTAIRTQKKLFLKRRIIRLAAAAIFPLLIAGGIYFYISNPAFHKTTTNQKVAEISPGKGKAVLILDDGNSVVLETPEEEEILEKDGTVIRKSGEKLDYTKQKNKEALQDLFNTIHVPQGGEYNLVLSDGTRVFLNAMSEFKYPVHFTGESREVELSGEAFFEVTSSEQPFIVKTDNINIEVTGTSFNLNAYEDTKEVVTTLVEGKIKVKITDEPGKSLELMPEEQAIFKRDTRDMKVGKVDVSMFTGWKDGKLIFYDTRLEDIMTTLSRWYSSEVFYLNPSVKELHFSGSFNRYDDITQILDIIKSTKKVRIEVKGTTILFSERL